MKIEAIKQVDKLGRVVIPKNIRKRLHIDLGDSLIVSISGDKIIMQLSENKCTICNSKTKLVEFNGSYICKNCIDNINNQGGENS